MALREHLLEVRKRLFLSSVGIVVAAVVGWFLYDPVFALLQQPLIDASARNGMTVGTNFGGIATAFDMRLKVSFFLGVILSSPWWIYQLWAFITPGLTRKERRFAIGFLAAATPLFLGGIAGAWWVLPHAVEIFTEFVPDDSINLIDAQTYLSFVMRLMLAFGLACLMPVVMVLINFVGLVPARTWAGGWRWAILIAFVFAAVMTPTPDAITMLWVALPICVLYGVALGVCVLHDRRVAKRTDRTEAVLAPSGAEIGR
ncbi:Sec-independent protein translocase protein TatC [Paraoerskovia sediminicola]|uniref:Sec-independent protein translocase protein TatC n=1 Tax=Paraoerskovia sediminicola TaxID=1138587 RepID=A0ABN6XAL0_9CELL|nr:twin-arginine translocase subunit TatC [Paraoerskovia sediminicola]BDZ41953.1 Sec-independent protein translocase protein TatC [Paraoerskovia sediminicola]